MRIGSAFVGIAAMLFGWSGCGTEPDSVKHRPQSDPQSPIALQSDVVARIDSRSITLKELSQFRGDATVNYRDPEERLEAWRFYLQTMIDMELMLIEAQEKQLDQTMSFVRHWEEERRKKLVDEYSVRTIIKEVDLAVDDMRQSFAGSKWNRTLQLAHIRTESEAEAQRAMRDLEQGRVFSEVARERSIVPTTADRGGVLEPWYGRANLEDMGLTLEIGEQLFEMQIGEFSQPFLVGDYYEIFKVLAEGPAPEHYRASFLREQYWMEFRARWETLVGGLKERLEVRVDGDAIKLLVDRMAGAGRGGILLSPEDQEVTLVRFKGGQVTLRDFAETYNAYWFIRSVSFDSTGIAGFIQQDLLPRVLVYQAAMQEGLDQDSTIVTWMEDKKESLLLEALREKEVVERVKIDSALVHSYYVENPQIFMQLEEIKISEVLVATLAEAEKLLQQIRAGGDLDLLAARHTIRSDLEGIPYHMHNHASERRVFGALFDAVLEAEVGTLVGPVQLDRGYSVFKVLERIPPRPAPFAEAASRAKWWVQKEQETELFDELFVRLRDKYASRVAVFEERLKSLSPN